MRAGTSAPHARPERQDGRMLIVRATKKLLDRLGPPNLDEEEQSTTVLGQWYATAVFWQMHEHRLGKTSNRSVVGIMNEFTYLAGAYSDGTPAPDLFGLAMRLATTPCGPLYSKNVSPDRELAALVRTIARPTS
jgi:hypothetical protein